MTKKSEPASDAETNDVTEADKAKPLSDAEALAIMGGEKKPDIADSMLPKTDADWPFPNSEHTPTREEAKAMFRENPGLWSVLTDEGTITRDQC